MPWLTWPRPPKPATANGLSRTGRSIWAATSPPCVKVGARALFHLALEDKDLSESIANFLCAHIRETTGNKGYQEQNKDKPSTEMQSLLRLLFTTETVDERRLEEFWHG